MLTLIISHVNVNVSSLMYVMLSVVHATLERVQTYVHNTDITCCFSDALHELILHVHGLSLVWFVSVTARQSPQSQCKGSTK